MTRLFYVICVACLFSVDAFAQDAISEFDEKLTSFLFGSEIGSYLVKIEQHTAQYRDTDPSAATLEVRHAYLAINKDRTLIRVDVEGVEGDTVSPNNKQSRFLYDRRSDPSKPKMLLCVVSGDRFDCQDLREDHFTSVFYKPHSPFAIAFFGSSSPKLANWIDEFSGLETFVRPDQISHESIKNGKVVGWVGTRSIASMWMKFNRGDRLTKMDIETYPVHPKLDYDNPSKGTGWLTRSSTEWEQKGKLNLPIRVEHQHRNGFPGNFSCTDSQADIDWRFLATNDESVFEPNVLKKDDEGLKDVFQRSKTNPVE